MEKTEVQVMLDKKFEALDNANKKAQQDLLDAQEKNASKDELQKLADSVKTQGQALDDFIEEQRKKVSKTVLTQFKDFLNENKTELEKIKQNKHGIIEFTPKAVGDMATSSGGDGAVDPPPNHNTQLGNFNLRNDDSLLSLFSVTSTSSPSLAYTELQPKEGGYEFVAEAGTKPQIDFLWQNNYSTPVKAAAYEVLSEESVTDIPRMMSVARELLTKKHGLFKVDGLFFGDGVGENPEGATVIGRVFAAGDMALAVASPNFMDVVNACITDIYTTHNYTDEASYMANVVLINPIDFFLELVSAKDGNGLPLYPQASLFGQVNIGGVTIRPWTKIPAGNIFVADAKVYNVANYVPFSIRVGWINDQFITNQFTMVGESRFHAWVKTLDRAAMIYDSIATIRTAIAIA